MVLWSYFSMTVGEGRVWNPTGPNNTGQCGRDLPLCVVFLLVAVLVLVPWVQEVHVYLSSEVTIRVWQMIFITKVTTHFVFLFTLLKVWETIGNPLTSPSFLRVKFETKKVLSVPRSLERGTFWGFTISWSSSRSTHLPSEGTNKRGVLVVSVVDRYIFSWK